MKIVIMTLFLLVTTSVFAETTVYQRYDEDGAVEFSDVQRKEAKEVKVPEMPTYPAPKYKPIQPSPSSADTQKARSEYTIKITRPKNGTSVYENAGDVQIEISLKPALKNLHMLQFEVDGNKSRLVNSTSYTFKSLSRGQHTVNVNITNKQGKVIQSAEPVSFQLHRVSSLHPKPATNTPPANPNNGGDGGGLGGG